MIYIIEINNQEATLKWWNPPRRYRNLHGGGGVGEEASVMPRSPGVCGFSPELPLQ